MILNFDNKVVQFYVRFSACCTTCEFSLLWISRTAGSPESCITNPQQIKISVSGSQFLADRTWVTVELMVRLSPVIVVVLRPFVVCNGCIVAKRYVVGVGDGTIR